MRNLVKTIIAIAIISLLSISVLVISTPKESMGPVIVKLKKDNNEKVNTTINTTINETEEPKIEINGNWTEWTPIWRFVYEKRNE